MNLLYKLMKRGWSAAIDNDRTSSVIKEFSDFQTKIENRLYEIYDNTHLMDDEHRKAYLFRTNPKYINSMKDAITQVWNARNDGERSKWLDYLHEHELAIRNDIERVEFRT